MATQEHVQEALQRLQAQEARIAALEIQLHVEQTRTQTAELERSTLIQTLGAMRQDRGGADIKRNWSTLHSERSCETGLRGVDSHKVFMLARFGDQILVALTWAARQRKIWSRLADPRREIALHPGSMSLELVPTRRSRSTGSMISLEICILCLIYNRRTQPNRSERR